MAHADSSRPDRDLPPAIPGPCSSGPFTGGARPPLRSRTFASSLRPPGGGAMARARVRAGVGVIRTSGPGGGDGRGRGGATRRREAASPDRDRCGAGVSQRHHGSRRASGSLVWPGPARGDRGRGPRARSATRNRMRHGGRRGRPDPSAGEIPPATGSPVRLGSRGRGVGLPGRWSGEAARPARGPGGSNGMFHVKHADVGPGWGSRLRRGVAEGADASSFEGNGTSARR